VPLFFSQRWSSPQAASARVHRLSRRAGCGERSDRNRKETLALTRDEIATVARFQTDTVTRIFGVKITVDGVIPMALRTRHPLQLINPLAPAEYGNGFENVTADPDTRQATGIRFLGIKF
jgi:hypothetical protein